jgi:hypothetical protein
MKKRLHYVPLWLASLVLFVFVLPIIASASTYISQSYSTNETIPVGSIVSLQKNTSDQVVAAASSSVDNLIGVAVNAGNSLLSVNSGQSNQVQVATSGTLPVIVSDINGSIVRGDQITASPINGVGMKATSNVRVVGIAQGDLNESSGSKQTYTDADGAKHPILIGEIPILVNVSYFFKEPDKTLIPTSLQNMANALAGKSVSSLPIIISGAIFLVTIIVVVSIVFSMVRSSIISVGRNPMSQSAIYRDLIQLSVLVVVILAVGMAAIYLVLTRM